MGPHEQEFYDLLRTSPQHVRGFENCWPYIVQSTRNGFFSHRERNSIVYFTKRFPGNPLSPTVIVHALGPDRRDLILAVTHQEHAHGRQVRVKNVPRSELGWWQAHGFSESTEPWDEYCMYDDNTYPQYLNMRDVILTKNYGHEYQKVIRRFERERHIITEDFDDVHTDTALYLLDEFARRMRLKGAATYEEAHRAHLFFFDSSIDRRIRLQHVENGEMLAWSFLTPVGNTGYYNALVNRTEDDIQKYLTHEAKRWMLERHPTMKYVVQQGSEKEGQDYMKRRFGTPEPLHKTHVEYRG